MAESQPPTELLPYLYLGGVGDSLHHDLLSQLRITHILNVRETPPHPRDKPSVKFMHVPISDYGETDMLSVLDQCFGFINAARESGGRILVHCGFGFNRSPTVVIAYLMPTKSWNLRDSYHYVTARRPHVRIVEEYFLQLQQFEQNLFGTVSLTPDDIASSSKENT